MKLKEVKKLRKIVIATLVAGIMASQTMPSGVFGVDAMASMEDEAEPGSEDLVEEPAEGPASEDVSEEPTEDPASEEVVSEPAEESTEEVAEDIASEEVTEEPTEDIASEDVTEELAEDLASEDVAEEPTEDIVTGDVTEEPAADEELPADTEQPTAAEEDPLLTDVEETSAEQQPAEAVLTPAEQPETEEVASAETLADAQYAQESSWVPAPSGELVPAPVLYHGFRFWTIAKDYAFAAEDLNILEEKDSASRQIGTLAKDGLCYLIKDEGDGWLYVESGTVRGFVQADQLLTGEDAAAMVAQYQTMAESLTDSFEAEFNMENVALMAHEIVPHTENAAFAHYRATVYQTVVEKDPAVPVVDMVNIREAASDDARVVGVLASNGIAYVIADKDKDWVYVESGDVRGFVKREQILMTDAADGNAAGAANTSFLTKDEEDYATASVSIDPTDNQALYYTMTSIRSGVPDGMLRNSILQYASQFIGNPYVWGGTSLTNGADCSGFVQSIYAQYGYDLPRTAAEQSKVGTQIAVEDALPGDLIFYGNESGIYHVVIYAGDGQTVEAKSSRAGIVASEVSGSAVWAVRVIDEKQAVRYEIPEGLGDVHTYMGWQKVTSPKSQQWAFREAAGMTFDPEGFAVVDNRYVIACTTTFGNIGDYVDFYQEDGSVIPCVIGDFKNQSDAGCNAYGHLDGDCIIEFVVDENSWYPNGHANPGTESCHPEWNQDIVKAENVGSFYD